MRTDVKPFTYWVIHKGYSVRFARRNPTSVEGMLTTPEGEQNFEYNPTTLTIRLPDHVVTINQGGWETERHASAGDSESTGHDDG